MQVLNMKCDSCQEEKEIKFNYKEQYFNDKLIPGGQFCSLDCLNKHIKKFSES